MRRIKKWLLSACGAIGGLCLVFAGFGFANNDVQSVKAEESELSAYDVYGGSVRLVSDEHGNGVRFHVGMTMENFANYGTIAADGKTGVLNSNYQTGTLLLPAHLLNGKELVKGGTGYNATLSDTDTSELWYKKTVGDVEYMQSVVYLYNIPESDLGTEISVRGYIVDKSTGTPTYTDQLDTISMSAVADMEYYDEASKLTAEQKESLKQTYLDKEVTFHVNGTTEDTRVLYYNTPVSTTEAPATVANAEFVGWYKKDGVTPFDFTSPVKNDTNAYAIYRRDISIENGANVEDYIKDYTYTSVVSAVYTAPTDSEYTLASGVGAMDITALKAKPQDHGEGTLTVTMKNGDSTFSVPLPVTVVTKYIGTVADFQTEITNKTAVENTPLYGYFKLTADIGTSADWVDPGLSGYVSGWDAKGWGFSGTLNGQGYKVYTRATTYWGMFTIMRGATVKNVTVSDGWISGDSNYSAVFGHQIIDSVFENVTLINTGNSTGYGNRPNATGWFCNNTISGTRFKDVTICAQSMLELTGVFGTTFYGESTHADVCTFENFVIENITLTRLGSHSYWKHAYVDASVGDGQTQTISSVDYTTAVVKGVVVKTSTASATVSGTQEVILNSDSNAISLGDGYEDADIISVTLGGYDLGTDLENLEIPQNMISDGAVFGNQTVTVLANVNGVATTITVPVSVSQVETTKVALGTMQDLVMTDDTFSITLGDQYKTAQIQSIMLDGTSLGTTLSALNISDAIKTNTQNHGEQEIIVSATYKGAPYQFTVPVTLVTEYITSIERIVELSPRDETRQLYGYYKLANDVGASDANLATLTGQAGLNTNATNKGWLATLDGNGYSITYKSAYNCRGLFGQIGEGAVIKNVTINEYNYDSKYMTSGFAVKVQKATLSNVVYNVRSCANTSRYYASGVLAYNGFNNTTLNNVVINAQGLTIESIFGGFFVPSNCTFNNVYVYASTLGELGNTAGAIVAGGFPTGTAITSVSGITVATAPTNTNVTLDGTQDIVLSKATNALDLGTYANAGDVTSITLTMGGTNYDLGTNASALNIPTEAVDAKDKHGNATVKVVCVDKLSLSTTTVTINVLVVTKDITTTDEFVETFKMTTIDPLYGYYRLANDIGDANFKFFNNYSAPNYTYGAYGFRGTFDGNNKMITGKSNQRGMFGIVGYNAVIKNLTVNDCYYGNNANNAGYQAVFATLIARATFTNVTVNMLSAGTAKLEANVGWLAYMSTFDSTFTNVTLNAEGLDIAGLFGYGYYEKNPSNGTDTDTANVFNNVTVIANSVLSIGMTGSTNVTSEEGILLSLPTVKATLPTQDTLVSAPSLDLGEYTGLTVASIKSLDGATDYGTNAGALTGVTAGETTLVVSGTLNAQSHEITVPVVFADGIITTMEELETAVRYYDTDKSGYYALANDIAFDASALTAKATTTYNDLGFTGTLNGMGHSIAWDMSVANTQNGIFGSLSSTAVVTNLTVNATNYAIGYQKNVFATYSRAKFTDVTINISGVGGTTIPTDKQYGAVIGSASYSGAWTNVVINSDTHLEGVFGTNAANLPTFTDCVLNVPSYGILSQGTTTKAGLTITTPTIYNISLDAQAITTESKAISLGEYSDITITGIATSDGVSLGDDASALSIPDSMTVGEYTVVVKGSKNGEYYNITIPVAFADGIITTMSELVSAVRYDGTDKSGYYALANDIAFDASALTAAAATHYNDVGFTGTLNGMGHSIAWDMGVANTKNGIFGSLSGTAVVTNLTVNATNYAIGYQKNVFATYSRAKFTDVTINISGVGGTTIPTDKQYGAVIGSASYSGAWTNVVINSDTHLEGVFGTNAANLPTFTDCVLNVPSYGILSQGTTTKAGLTITLTKSLTEREVWIDTDKSLDLGDYAGYTVTSIKTANGEYDFGTNANALTIPSGITTGRTTLIVKATDGTLDYKITVPVNFCSFEEATSIEITDTTEQAIDLGITAGTVNNDQTYTIALDGLSKYNFRSATMKVDGTTHTFESMTFNVNVFGKTFGTTEMTITYLCSDVEKTITVPVVIATKVLRTADDINNWTAWADAYDGTTGDWKYDGYFVLGNDIEYNATFETLKYGQADATGKPIEVASGQEELGFRGTFDGRGYAIKNMRVSDTFNGNRYYSSTSPHTFEKNETDKGTHYRFTAFITKMHANGVLRNVAFDGGVADYNAYLVGWGEGLVENVYVKYTQTNAVDSQYVVTINNGAAYGKVTMKNAIIDITEQQFNFQHATNKYFLIGQANDTYNLYQNVFIVGEMTDKMVGVRYQNTDLGTGEDGSIPRGYDYFVNYSTVSEFLAYHADQVNGWNYFHADADEVWMNGDALMTATNTATKPDTKYFVNASRTATDYVIVYDERNDAARETAGFIGEMFYRATGTVAYEVNNDSPGTFTEYVTGGVLLPRATTATWNKDEDDCYIVIGDVKGMPVSEALSTVNTTNTYVIKSYGNHSVFIYAQDENDYLAAAYNFLEEALGFQAYDDDVVAFNYSGDVTFDGSRFDIVVESAFSVRSQTGATNPYKNAQRTMNGQDFWSMGPTAVDRTTDEERVWGVHNTMYWLPYETYGSTYAKWYRSAVSRTYTKPDGTSGTYNAYDICYTAGGDSTQYNAMVSTLAGKMVDVLNANPDKTALTFSMMDDYSMDRCDCSGCSAISTSNNTAAALKFLSDVASAIEEELPGRDFELYTLAYYYLLTAPTTAELTSADLTDGKINEHVGVLYAPVRVADESLGLVYATDYKDSKNEAVYNDMVAWSKLTNNVALWFYDTIYHNYMMPIDTFESMINWLAYAVEIFGTDVAWVTVNGQSRQYTQTAFESFKGYVVHRAEIEVYEKVVKGGITDAKIKAYLTELEGEFFNFTVAEDGTKTFADGGYYGTAVANEAMYNMYSSMRTYYQGKRDGSTKAFEGYGGLFGTSSVLSDMTGNTSEEYDYVNFAYQAWGSTHTKDGTFENWLTTAGTTGTLHFVNFTTDEINEYMGYLEKAMASVNDLDDSNSMKKVYQQKVLIESLFPRFVICNGNDSEYWADGYTHSGSIWTGTLASARTAFKTDCTNLGVVNYAEHASMSDVFTKWGI